MKRSHIIILLLTAFLAALHPACKPRRGVVEKIKDSDQIKMLYAGYQKAVANASYPQLAKLYSDRGASSSGREKE